VEDLIPNSKLRSLCLRHYFSSVLPSWFLSVYYSFSSFWWRRSFLIRIAVFCSPTTSFCIMSALNFVVSNIEFLCSIGAVSVMIFIPKFFNTRNRSQGVRKFMLVATCKTCIRCLRLCQCYFREKSDLLASNNSTQMSFTTSCYFDVASQKDVFRFCLILLFDNKP